MGNDESKKNNYYNKNFYGKELPEAPSPYATKEKGSKDKINYEESDDINEYEEPETSEEESSEESSDNQRKIIIILISSIVILIIAFGVFFTYMFMNDGFDKSDADEDSKEKIEPSEGTTGPEEGHPKMPDVPKFILALKKETINSL